MADLWAVSVRGPDDLIAVQDAVTAHRVAHAYNAWWLGLIEANGLGENDPHIWASPVTWPYEAELHAHDLANPSNDYAGIIASTGANPPKGD